MKKLEWFYKQAKAKKYRNCGSQVNIMSHASRGLPPTPGRSVTTVSKNASPAICNYESNKKKPIKQSTSCFGDNLLKSVENNSNALQT